MKINFLTADAQSESPNVPQVWETLAEQTDYRKSWNYADTIAFGQKLNKASDGKSGEGRDLPLLIAVNGKSFTPEQAKKS